MKLDHLGWRPSLLREVDRLNRLDPGWACPDGSLEFGNWLEFVYQERCKTKQIQPKLMYAKRYVLSSQNAQISINAGLKL